MDSLKVMHKLRDLACEQNFETYLLGSHFYVISISYDKTHFICLLFVIVFHMVHIICLISAFRIDKYEANQNSQS